MNKIHNCGIIQKHVRRDIMIYKPYKHLVQYYETDQMGIVHHSNYIRWFEEQGHFFLKRMALAIRKWKNQA